MSAEHPAAQRRPECVERWPECESGAYDPRCCRFPKSCSCNVQPEEIAAQDQEWLATLAWIIDRLYSGGSWMAMQRDKPEIDDAMKRLREVVGDADTE